VSQDNPNRIVAHLDDPRWYLIRNLVFVLGRCRNPDVVAHVVPLTEHIDARVRRESLRAIHSLTRYEDITPFVDGMTDPDESVRKAALTILRTCEGRAVVPALEAILTSSVDTEIKLDVIALLGMQFATDAQAGTPLSAAARNALERQAASGSGGRGANRALRSAARQALEGSA
jgi:hypothetical protein